MEALRGRPLLRLLLLLLLQAIETPGTTVSAFLPGFVLDVHAGLLVDFKALNSTGRDYPNVSFTKQQAPNDVESSLQATRMVFEHANPEVRASLDIFYMDIVYAPALSDYAADLKSIFEADWFKNPDGSPRIVGSYMQAFTVGGELVGLPDYVQTGVFYYRKDLMRRYGLCTCETAKCKALPAEMQDCDPPATWDEMERMAKIIQDGERPSNDVFWGFVHEGKSAEGLMCRLMELLGSHADPADPAMAGLDIDPIIFRDGTVVVNRNHTVKALRRFANWLGYITPFLMKDWGAGAVRDEFKKGNAAFMVNWLSMMPGLNDEGAVSRGNTGIWRSPGLVPGLGRGTAGGFAYGMSKTTDDPRAAMGLLKFLVSRHAAIAKHLGRGQIPAVAEFMGPNRPPEICRRECPSCAVPCDVDLTGTFVVARPSLGLKPHYREASLLMTDVAWEVLNGALSPEKAALKMECGLVELLYGANAQPERCKIRNECGLGQSKVNGACERCPAGKSADLFTSFCVDCARGFATPADGSSACEGCLPGRFAEVVGSTNCTVCSAGSFQRTFAQSQCSPCEPGFFQVSDGQTACAACKTGRFQDLAGRSDCKDCAPDKSTLGRGAGSPADCICLAGTYLNAGQCLKCMEGIVCPGGDAAPTTEDGYFAGLRSQVPPEAFSGVTAEFSVFKCSFNAKACPAGPIGTCAAGRVGIMCYDCDDGLAAQDDGTCAACSGGNKALFVFLFVFLIIAICVAYFFTDKKEHIAPTHSALLPVAVGSMCVTSIQQLGIVGMTSVEFVNPVKTVLTIPIFLLQFDLLSADCLVSMSSVKTYVFRSCGVLILITTVIGVHSLFVMVRHHGSFRARRHRLVFVLGTLMMVFMISSVNTSIAPFQCEKHPNGLSTVRKYGTVICGKSEDHGLMVGLGLTFLLIPITFLANCCTAVYRFPKRMQLGDVEFLEAYGFLFTRFKPDRYWYALLFIVRSFVIAMAPTLPDAPSQIMAIAVVSLIWLCLTTRLYPWRSDVANLLDMIITAFMINLVYISAFFAPADASSLSAFATIVVCVILILPACFMVYAAFALITLRHRKPFKFFLCHHKGGAGAFSRLLKMMLLQGMHKRSGLAGQSAGIFNKLFGKQDVFIDTDDLRSLGTLFDTVASKVETLVVVQSKSLLLRPWCVGEITTACIKNVRVARLSMPDFAEPDDEFIANYKSFVDTGLLGPFGIHLKQIQRGLQWLRELETRMLPASLTITEMMDITKELTTRRSALGALASMGQAMSTMSTRSTDHSETDVLMKSGLFIVVDQSDSEATASALCLRQLLLELIMRQITNTRSSMEIAAMIPTVLPKGTALPTKARTCIFALSSMCFRQPAFDEALIDAAVLNVKAVPVVVEDHFKFPVTPEAETETRHMVTNTPALNNIMKTPEVLIAIQENLFKEIAVTFNPSSATISELKLKAEDVCRRILDTGGTTLQRPNEDDVTIHRQTL